MLNIFVFPSDKKKTFEELLEEELKKEEQKVKVMSNFLSNIQTSVNAIFEPCFELYNFSV